MSSVRAYSNWDAGDGERERSLFFRESRGGARAIATRGELHATAPALH
jgi:hypothetical protein